VSRLTPVVFPLDVDNTLVDNDGVQADLRVRLDSSSARGVATGTGPSLSSSSASSVTAITSAPCSATASSIWRTWGSSRCPPGSWTTLRQASLPGRPGRPRTAPRVWRGGHPVRRGRGLPATESGAVRHLGRRGRNGAIYIHKELELEDVARRYPAEHYALVDDKPRILRCRETGLGGNGDDGVSPAGTLRRGSGGGDGGVTGCEGRAYF
jgi:hypothetical protein